MSKYLIFIITIFCPFTQVIADDLKQQKNNQSLNTQKHKKHISTKDKVLSNKSTSKEQSANENVTVERGRIGEFAVTETITTGLLTPFAAGTYYAISEAFVGQTINESQYVTDLYTCQPSTFGPGSFTESFNEIALGDPAEGFLLSINVKPGEGPGQNQLGTHGDVLWTDPFPPHEVILDRPNSSWGIGLSSVKLLIPQNRVAVEVVLPKTYCEDGSWDIVEQTKTITIFDENGNSLGTLDLPLPNSTDDTGPYYYTITASEGILIGGFQKTGYLLSVSFPYDIYSSDFPLANGLACQSGDAAIGIHSCGGPDQLSDVPTNGNRSDAYGAINLQKGQEILDEYDIIELGRSPDIPLEIKRRHISRKEQDDSPFGPSWAFNYRQTFKSVKKSSTSSTPSDLIMCSFGREDVFKLIEHTPELIRWQGTAGRFGTIDHVRESGISTLRFPGGTTLTFLTRDTDPSDTEEFFIGILSSIQSPIPNNHIDFQYIFLDPEPNLDDFRLNIITDSFGRSYSFEYRNTSFPNHITKIIEDFSGREWLYTYNSNGQLIEVTSPTVNSTQGLNDFPNGKTKQYTYHPGGEGFLDKLKNSLTSVTYPNQAASSGEPRLAWTFDETVTKPNGNFNFFSGFVKTHTVGNSDGSVGGTFTYDYNIVFKGNREGGIPGPNDVVWEHCATDRMGTKTTYEFNQLGQKLSESIATKGLRTGEPEERKRTYQYTADGDLVEAIDYLGVTAKHEQPDPEFYPRAAQANKICEELFPDSLRFSDQDMLRSEIKYEPIFQLPFHITDARGNVTIRYPDYFEDTTSAVAHFAPMMGLEDSELQELIDREGIHLLPGVNSDINGDGRRDQFCGQIVKVKYSDVRMPPAAGRVGEPTIQIASEFFQYNDYGQMVYYKDARNNVTRYEYNQASNPDGAGLVTVPDAPTQRGGGYLKRVVRDSDRGGDSGSRPVKQTFLYRYGSIGNVGFPGNPRGVPTTVTDPRGTTHLNLVNELDQVVKTVAANSVTEGGLEPFGYERITLYDHNNNITEIHIQNKDSHDDLFPTDFIKHRFTYDILDQLVKEELDYENGEGHTRVNIVNEYKYDANQNLIEKISGSEIPGTDVQDEESIQRWTYDERDILISHTRAANTSDSSTRTTQIDDNGNITHWIDAEGGDVSETVYDGFNRVKETIDRMGNRTIYTYDPNSNTTQIKQIGPSIPGGGPIDLSITENQYDERNRLVISDQLLKHYTGRSVGRIDGGAPGGRNRVRTTTIYDANNRVIGMVDADDDTYKTQYDGLSRVIRTLDPLGNEIINEYDTNSNLIKIIENEKSTLTPSETFITQYEYDALNRLTKIIEPNGQQSVRQYDSRNNVVTIIDQLGNQVGLIYDGLSRLIETKKYLSNNGYDAGPSNFDLSQSGDGLVSLKQSWDDLNRMVTQTDDLGNVTTYVYDDINRKVKTIYQDQTEESWTYNRDSELLTHINQNGSEETWSHDAKGRPTQVSISNPIIPEILGTTFKTWRYDGLDRVVQVSDNNGDNEDVTVEYWYDSLSRIIKEKQQIGSLPTLSINTEWSGASRKVSCQYPNGRIVTRNYDALDRISQIRESSDNSLIAEFQYIGPGRDILCTYGNGATLDKRINGYDSNRRHVDHIWTDPSGNIITSYTNTYNDRGTGDQLGTNRRISETRAHLFDHQDLYTFDSTYRMLSFNRNNSLLSTRSLDGADSMISFFDEGIDKQPIVDGSTGEEGMNQYSSFNEQHITYDDNSSLKNLGNFKFIHDYDNRIVEVRNASDDSLIERYVYAADNRRVFVAKDTTGTLGTRYLYGGWQVLEERDANNQILRQYVDGRHIDEHIQLKDIASDRVFFYHCNSQGFVGALSDHESNPVEFYEYSWLGRPTILAANKIDDITNQGSSVGNVYMFQGRRYEPSTGLYYYRNRYYSPEIGRFLTIDPLGDWQTSLANGFSAFKDKANSISKYNIIFSAILIAIILVMCLHLKSMIASLIKPSNKYGY